MNELIKINETYFNKNMIRTVNARDLHCKLESKQEFANWIKNRLERFVDNADYINVDNFIKIENTNISRPIKDYYLSIDCAKMICMLENNKVGDEIRKYFIECEKVALNPFKVPTNLKEALKLALNQQEEIEKKDLLILDKQETIDIISINEEERQYKKKIRSDIVKLVNKFSKQTGMMFSDIYKIVYEKFMNNYPCINWKLDFFKAENKLDFLNKKDISYIKDMKNVVVSILKTNY